MTTEGVDYAWERPDPHLLRAAGFEFAIRYGSNLNDGKDLTPNEADELAAAGLSIVANWEQNPSGALQGYLEGVADAHSAQSLFARCGMPAGRPIYFSVDFDAQPSQMPAVDAYFAGVATVIGRTRVGAYGGFAVIRHLAGNGGAHWLWQTTAWSHGQWVDGVHIRQTTNEVPFGADKLDHDLALVPDFGQWVPNGSDTPPTDRSDPMLSNWHNFSKGDGNSSTPNEAVKTGQALLNRRGATGRDGRALLVDGIDGDNTDYAVRVFQAHHGLQVDGIFGPHTLSVALYGTDYA